MSNNLINSTTQIDTTLTKEGYAADAKAVGDELYTRTFKHFGVTGYNDKSNSVTYDMSGKPVGLYMVCFFRSNKIFLLFMKDDGTLEWTADSNDMTITDSKVTFNNLSWYDTGRLFKLF